MAIVRKGTSQVLYYGAVISIILLTGFANAATNAESSANRENLQTGEREQGEALLSINKRSTLISLHGWNCTGSDWMECDDGECIYSALWCNGFPNCNDGSDENAAYCLNNVGGFECHDGSRWVPDSWYCNGLVQCDDASDENTTCSCADDEFTCDNGVCIHEHLRCNGLEDCGDWSDEAWCNCTDSQFSCNSIYDTCIDLTEVFDIKHDCWDGSDEAGWVDGCPAGQFNCANGTSFENPSSLCINESLVCDGIADCVDHSDEAFNCSAKSCDIYANTPNRTVNNTFRCVSFDNPREYICLNSSQVCDYGTRYCSDYNLQQSFCDQTYSCSWDQYACNGDCIYSSWYLNDDWEQCDDGWDELTLKYGQESYRDARAGVVCRESGQKIGNDRVCDGINDCNDPNDWTDECFCDGANNDTALHYCYDDHSRCIATQQVCNGVADCNDWSDEMMCFYSYDFYYCLELMDNGRNFTCKHDKHNYGRCVNIEHVCNGIKDCSDGSDEEGCLDSCNDDYLRCGTGISIYGDPCLHHNKWCDENADCVDHSDEDPRICQDVQCGSGEYYCMTSNDTTSNGYGSYQCLAYSELCDGSINCIDGSDESAEVCSSVTFAPCQDGRFQCNDGTCIQGNWQCDGWNDCTDGIDEFGCNCPPDEGYVCMNDGTCIPLSWRCDGGDDCGDSNDEVGCPECNEDEYACANGDCMHIGETCPDNCVGDDYACSNGECIDINGRCDSFFDCSDWSDELWCTSTTSPSLISCPSPNFRCSDNLMCISASKKCDEYDDCYDKSDEWFVTCLGDADGQGSGSGQGQTGLPVYAYALIAVAGVIGLSVLIGVIAACNKYGKKSSSGRNNTTAPSTGTNNVSRPNYKIGNSKPNYNLQNTTTRPNYNLQNSRGYPQQQPQSLRPQATPAYNQAHKSAPYTNGQPLAMPMTTFQSSQPVQQPPPQQPPPQQPPHQQLPTQRLPPLQFPPQQLPPQQFQVAPQSGNATQIHQGPPPSAQNLVELAPPPGYDTLYNTASTSAPAPVTTQEVNNLNPETGFHQDSAAPRRLPPLSQSSMPPINS